MTADEHAAIDGRSLVLYDGVCGLCNRVVQLLLRLDRDGQFRFAPLETPLALEVLQRFPVAPDEPEGVILITNALTRGEAIYRRFDAVGEALRLMHGPYRVLGRLLRLVPRFLREGSYGLIARNRYRLFGRHETCPVPSPEQRARILGL